LEVVGKTEAERMAEQMEAIGKKLDEVAAAMLAAAEGQQSAADKIDGAADKMPRTVGIDFRSNVPGTVQVFTEVGG
jgi:hypothetical protein